MNIITEIVKMENIRQIVQDKQLKTIILETGNKNIFILEENKFIVTKDFLKNKIEVFRGCESLETIVMEDFDFSEITTMEFWFLRCFNLQEIIFPIKSNCQNLTDLYGCFSYTNMNTIDLSFMNFEHNENLVSLACTFCVTTARKVVLPQININRIDGCFLDSTNLEEIIAPIKIYSENKDSFISTFENCPKLKFIDLSMSNMENKALVQQITKPINKNNISKDCVIILP